MIEHKADVDFLNKFGQTPFLYAITGQADKEIFDLLYYNWTKLDLRDSRCKIDYQQSSLKERVNNLQPDIIKEISRRDATIRAVNEFNVASSVLYVMFPLELVEIINDYLVNKNQASFAKIELKQREQKKCSCTIL